MSNPFNPFQTHSVLRFPPEAQTIGVLPANFFYPAKAQRDRQIGIPTIKTAKPRKYPGACFITLKTEINLIGFFFAFGFCSTGALVDDVLNKVLAASHCFIVLSETLLYADWHPDTAYHRLQFLRWERNRISPLQGR